LFGHEFVAILASLTGLLVATLTAKKGFLLPDEPWQEALQEEKGADEPVSMSLWAAWAPYVIIVLLLLVTRIVPSVKSFALTWVDLSWADILGVEGITSSWQVLYSPGSVLVFAAIMAVVVQRKSFDRFAKAAKESVLSMKDAALALVATLALVQVFTNSGMNAQDLVSMPQYIAQTLAAGFGSMWVMVAPFLGQLGAFITGSATVSTLTFSPVQYSIAQETALAKDTVLSLQVLGSSAGNMICVHNVVAAGAVVGLAGKEGDIIRKTIGPALLYGLLVGTAALVYLFFT
ncbi:L-lactate permease, partial [Halobacillus trueperi]|uniref:L-lactate permease n=1 Tax=Halobacillus trueperi TaxID=156205 RepID=UPI002162C45A